MTGEPFDDKEARFVELIALGGTMRSVADELSVSPSLLCKWLADPSRKELREQYAHAREAQGDIYADRVVDTAMDPTIDPAVARVRIDALKWAAGKRKPKVYGDKVTTEHSGPGGGDIIIRATIGGTIANNDG
jgi:hypothetical protein